MHMLSKHALDFSAYKKRKIDRFRSFGLDKFVITKCEEWQPKILSDIAMSHVCVIHDKNIFRVVIPYSTFFEARAKWAQSHISAVWKQLLTDVKIEQVQLVFRNSGRPLSHKLRNLKYEQLCG